MNKKDCNHLWIAVSCDPVPEEDFEEENEFGELVYFIVEKTTYQCKHCQQEYCLLNSRPD